MQDMTLLYVSSLQHTCNCNTLKHLNTFSPHTQAAEDFLQGMMSLYVSSHYKNSPNDLQLLSDAPAHQLFGSVRVCACVLLREVVYCVAV